MNGENASKKPQALASCRYVHNKSRAPVLMSCSLWGRLSGDSSDSDDNIITLIFSPVAQSFGKRCR